MIELTETLNRLNKGWYGTETIPGLGVVMDLDVILELSEVILGVGRDMYKFKRSSVKLAGKCCYKLGRV